MTNETTLASAVWRTSAHSTSGNQCVEIAPLPSGGVAVRDSKNRDAGIHLASAKAWATFTAALKSGEL